MRLASWAAAGLLLGTTAAAADVCPLFVIERQGARVAIVRDSLAEGEVRVFQRDLAAGTIDVVLPVGPGQSAGFLQPSDADRIVMRYAGGKLSGRAQRAGGSSVDLATRALDELRRQDIRVSVSAGDGARAAFLISGYRTVAADTAGPTQNLFAGRLPEAMLKAGVVVLTDTYARDPALQACGRVALERQRWLFARARRADGAQGSEGWFIVDLAASVSLVARSFLPSGAQIHTLSMSEHSAAGTRRLPYSPSGATGPIASVAGSTVLPSLTFGDLALKNVEMTVLEKIPDNFGRPVAGILGMDVLRGCGVLRLDLPADGASATLTLAPAPAGAGAAGAAAAETPFSWIASHVVVRGTLDGRPVHWILDSGSPRTVVDSVGAPALDRKSTRLNSSHLGISYAVFCLKKKK